MKRKTVAIKTIALGISAALITSGLAFAAISSASNPSGTDTLVSEDNAGSFIVAQKQRSNRYDPPNVPAQYGSGGWFSGGNVG